VVERRAQSRHQLRTDVVGHERLHLGVDEFARRHHVPRTCLHGARGIQPLGPPSRDPVIDVERGVDLGVDGARQVVVQGRRRDGSGT
jgi:hypothetical protein